MIEDKSKIKTENFNEDEIFLKIRTLKEQGKVKRELSKKRF